MKVTEKMLEDVKSCCHNGHGASLFEDGECMQAISSNDILAYSTSDGWVYRIGYVDDPGISLEELQRIYDEASKN